MNYRYKKVKTPNGHLMDEHRYIWIKNYGEIPSGYEIHHKDENKSNNDISNLELIEGKLHRQLHLSGTKLVDRISQDDYNKFVEGNISRGLELRKNDINSNISWCNCCKQYKPLECFTKNKKRYNGLQDQCKDCRKLKRNGKKLNGKKQS